MALWNVNGDLQLIENSLNELRKEIDVFAARISHQHGTPIAEGSDQKLEVKRNEDITKVLTAFQIKLRDLNHVIHGCRNSQIYFCLHNNDIYHLIIHIPDEEWNHFMRNLFQHLSDEQIDSFSEMRKTNPKEAKYNMMKEWMKKIKNLNKEQTITEIKRVLDLLQISYVSELFDESCKKNAKILNKLKHLTT
ncbi:uncharacterized protein LOC134615373 isoform X2 [Pelobates fuscus]|uniref:uncharacterized protein LOC134615373 isoform X2 n=1 Tax=Pelobates fuscus TaxID=191477 RepID=UPI002FE45D24